MTEIQETDLCIVCNKPGARFYSKKDGNLKWETWSTRKSTRLKKKDDSDLDPEEELEQELLLPQLRVMFLLKQIFKFPVHGEEAVDVMQVLGDPSEWFDVCNGCAQLVDEGLDILRKLRMYELKRERVVEELDGKVATSYSRDFGKLVLVREEVDKFSRARLKFRKSIRKDLHDIPAEIKVETEPIIADSRSDEEVTWDDGFEPPSPSFEVPIETETLNEDVKPNFHIVKRGRPRGHRKDPESTDMDYHPQRKKRGKSISKVNLKERLKRLRMKEIEELEGGDLLKKYKSLRQTPKRRKVVDIERKNFFLKRPLGIRNPKPKVARSVGGRSLSKGSKLFFENGDQHLDMTLITYPPKTAADRAKIPKDGKSDSKMEQGECRARTNFDCPSCGKYFANKYYAIAHIHRFHLGIEKPWKCNHCTKTNADSRHMRRHVESHKLGTLLTCQICKSFNCQQKHTLDTHMINHEKNTGKHSTCHECNKSFRQFTVFVQHMTNEHGFDYRYKSTATICEICSASFKNRRRFDFHKVKEHNEMDPDGKFPMCSECSEIFLDHTRLTEHTERVHSKDSPTFFCEHCGKGFVMERTLKRHVIITHDSTTRNCQVCGASFQGPENAHMRRLHPETMDMSQEEIDEYVQRKKEESRFKCKLCSQAFPFSNLLYQHHRRDHPEITDKFKCTECGKGFSRQCSVKRHFETEHLKLEVKCEHCEKIFYSKNNLSQHLKYYCKTLKKLEKSGKIIISSSSQGISLPNQVPQTSKNASTISDPRLVYGPRVGIVEHQGSI